MSESTKQDHQLPLDPPPPPYSAQCDEQPADAALFQAIHNITAGCPVAGVDNMNAFGGLVSPRSVASAEVSFIGPPHLDCPNKPAYVVQRFTRESYTRPIQERQALIDAALDRVKNGAKPLPGPHGLPLFNVALVVYNQRLIDCDLPMILPGELDGGAIDHFRPPVTLREVNEWIWLKYSMRADWKASPMYGRAMVTMLPLDGIATTVEMLKLEYNTIFHLPDE